MTNNKKNAFTLAEMLITLAVVGAIVAILLPSAVNIAPDEDVMRFKSANHTLGTVIKELVSSDKYFYQGSLAQKPDETYLTTVTETDPNNGADDNAKQQINQSNANKQYFCNAFADVVSVVSNNCSSLTNGTASVNFTLADDIYASNAQGTTIDTTCEGLKTGDYKPQILLSNGVGIFESNSNKTFADFNTPDGNGIYNDYKIICLDIDVENTNASETIFGYGLRVDGKLVPGNKANAWMQKEINDKE